MDPPYTCGRVIFALTQCFICRFSVCLGKLCSQHEVTTKCNMVIWAACTCRLGTIVGRTGRGV